MRTTICVAIAILAMPACAQATQLVGGGTELAKESTVRWQSSSLGAQARNEKKEDVGTLTCTSSELEGKVTANQGESVELTVAKGTFTGCKALGSTIDVAINATTEKPWTLQIQKPEESGHFTAHLHPASGSSLQFTMQIQSILGDLGVCDFSASAVKFSGQEGSDLLTVEGTEQFTKQSGPSLCGQSASLVGDAVLESSGEWVTATRAISTHLCTAKEMKCAKENIYGKGTKVEGALKGESTLFTGVACGESSFQAETAADTGNPLLGTMTALEFSNCSSTIEPKNACTVKALKLNYLVGFYPMLALGDGTMAIILKELEISCANEKKACKFNEKGLPELSLEGGEAATAYAENEAFVLVAGGNAKECGVGTKWSGTYTVTVPDPLYVSLE